MTSVAAGYRSAMSTSYVPMLVKSAVGGVVGAVTDPDVTVTVR